MGDTVGEGNNEPEEDAMTVTEQPAADATAEPAADVEQPAVAKIESPTPATTIPARSDDPDPAVEAKMEAWRAGGDLAEPSMSAIPELSVFQQMEQISRRIARSSLVPAHIRTANDPEADCLVTLMMARDLGISMTLAFQKTMVIDGQPGQMAELMRILAVRDGHRVRYTIERDEVGRAIAATCFVRRKGEDDETDATFSLKDAVAAGLCGISNETGYAHARNSSGKKLGWEKYTEDMLIARATSRALRRACPDSLGGVSYTPEELGAIEVENLAGDERIDAPAAVLELLNDRVAQMSDETRAIMARKWKDAKIGSLKPREHGPLLSTDEIPVAKRLLDEAEFETPAEAELVADPSKPHVFVGPASAAVCVSCDLPRVDDIHVEPTAGPEESGQSDVSSGDAQESAANGTTSDIGPGETDRTTVGVGVHQRTGEVTETVGDPTAEPASGPAEASEGPNAPTEAPAEAETAAQPVSRPVAQVHLPLLGDRPAERFVDVEVAGKGRGKPKSFLVGYQLVDLPAAVHDVEVGTPVRFEDAAGHWLVGIAMADYRSGEEPV